MRQTNSTSHSVRKPKTELALLRNLALLLACYGAPWDWVRNQDKAYGALSGVIIFPGVNKMRQISKQLNIAVKNH